MGTITQERRVGTEAFQGPLEQHIQGADMYVDRVTIEGHARTLVEYARQNQVDTIKTTKSYHNDARTALFEALTASGHLSEVEIHGKSLDDINRQVLSVLLNGWSDNLPIVEKQRRFQEICEELTIQEIHAQIASGILPEDMLVSTISDFPESLHEASAKRIGYRPYNKKGMCRSVGLKRNLDGSFTRVIEQASRSNAFASATEHFLQQNNIKIQAGETADSRVLGTQLVSSSREMEEGVVGLLKRLDQHRGANIKYGERQHAGQVGYHELKTESRRREQQAECYIEALAQFTEALDLRLKAHEINQQQHNELLKTEIHRMLQAICTMQPAYAKDCFGEESVRTYQQAADYTARGEAGAATQVIRQNQHLEQTVTLCGMSLSPEKAQLLGVTPDSVQEFLKLGQEKWKWSKGQCRVNECPTRPGETQVGPCSVCALCQEHFDKRRNPTRVYKMMKKAGTLAVKKSKNIWDVFKKDKTVRR